MPVDMLYKPVESFWSNTTNSGWKYCEFRAHAIFINLAGQVIDHVHVREGAEVMDYICDRIVSAPWRYESAEGYMPRNNVNQPQQV